MCCTGKCTYCLIGMTCIFTLGLHSEQETAINYILRFTNTHVTTNGVGQFSICVFLYFGDGGGRQKKDIDHNKSNPTTWKCIRFSSVAIFFIQNFDLMTPFISLEHLFYPFWHNIDALQDLHR